MKAAASSTKKLGNIQGSQLQDHISPSKIAWGRTLQPTAMITKSISKHPGTEDMAQPCLGAPGAALDCRLLVTCIMGIRLADGFIHGYQQILGLSSGRWLLLLQAIAGNSHIKNHKCLLSFWQHMATCKLYYKHSWGLPLQIPWKLPDSWGKTVRCAHQQWGHTVK